MNITWRWSTTTTRFPGREPPEIIEICRHAGLSGLEGDVTTFVDCSSAEMERIGNDYRQAGVPIETFHLPFTTEDDVAAFYESERRQTVAKMRAWMEKASLLGARIGVVHPSTKRYNVAHEGLDRYLAAFGKSMQELLPAAEELEFTLALENMLPGAQGGRFGSQPEHFEQIRRHYAHPRLKFCLDTGHALVAMRERAGEIIEAMGGDLCAFHLQDNPGDRDTHLAPGHGRVNWDEVFHAMAKLNYEGIACIEAVPFDFGPDYSADAWKRTVDDVKNLAMKALQS